MRTTKSCPKCRVSIAMDAERCECGWTKAEKTTKTNTRPVVPCAHETCDLPARCRVQTPTGWANFCLPHYVRFYDDQARARCAEKGLLKRADESGPEYRARMLAYIRENSRVKRFTDATAPQPEQDAEAARLEDEWARTA